MTVWRRLSTSMRRERESSAAWHRRIISCRVCSAKGSLFISFRPVSPALVIRFPGRWLVCLRFHDIRNPPLRVMDQRPADPAPHLLHGGEQGFGLAHAVEFQVDDSIVWIIDGAQYPVATHAGPLPAHRIAVEGGLPGVKILYGVFDMQEYHV